MSPKQQRRKSLITRVVERLGAGATFSGVSEREIEWITSIPKSSVNRQINNLRDKGILEADPGCRRSVRKRDPAG